MNPLFLIAYTREVFWGCQKFGDEEIVGGSDRNFCVLCSGVQVNSDCQQVF